MHTRISQASARWRQGVSCRAPIWLIHALSRMLYWESVRDQAAWLACHELMHQRLALQLSWAGTTRVELCVKMIETAERVASVERPGAARGPS